MSSCEAKEFIILDMAFLLSYGRLSFLSSFRLTKIFRFFIKMVEGNCKKSKCTLIWKEDCQRPQSQS